MPKAAALVAGNLAGQAFGIATGAQKGFSFTSLATSAIGFSPFSPEGALSTIGAAAANAAVNNVVGQGIGIIAGEQKGFSWAGVAASAVGGAVGRGISNKLGVNKTSTDTFAYRNPVATSVITSAVSNTASELTRVAIDGGRINWTGVATGAVQAGVGTLTRKVIAQRDQLGNGNTVKVDTGNAVFEANQRLINANGSQSQGIYGVSASKGGLNVNHVGSYGPVAPESGGLNVTWFDNGLTSQDDLNAIQAGGLRVRALGIPEDVTQPVDRVATNVTAKNLENKGGSRFNDDVQARRMMLNSRNSSDWDFSNEMQAMHLALDKLHLNNAAEFSEGKYYVPQQLNYKTDGYELRAPDLPKTFQYDAAQSTLDAGTLVLGGGVVSKILGRLGKLSPILNDARFIAGANASLDVTSQAIDTNLFTEGNYRADKTLVAVGIGLTGARISGFLPATSNIGLKYVASAGVGGLEGGLNTFYSNVTDPNGNQKSVVQSIASSATFGLVGRASGNLVSSGLQSTYIPSYANKLGGRFETSISGLTNFMPIDTYNINFIPYDEVNKK